MGNELPTSQHSSHQYFSLFQSRKRKGQDILVCRRTVPYGKLREKWEELLIQLKHVPNEHIMTPRDWKISEKSICGSGQVLEIQYDHYASNLAELIQERASASKFFEESQLWYVMYALCEVGVNCRSLNKRIGDIRPQNILLNKQGQIKVLTFLSFPNDLNPFSEPHPKTYFSPQELQQRRKGYMQNNSDSIKNQSFSIGLTLLSMALLQNMNSIYNRKTDQVNQKQLEGSLKKLKEISFFSSSLKQPVKYSDSFCQGLTLLLKIEDHKRLGYVHLYKQIQPYLQEIQDFRPFSLKLEVPPESPQKQPRTTFKEFITLRSRTKRAKDEISRSNSYQKVPERVIPVNQTTVIESRFVGQPAFNYQVPPPPLKQLKTTAPSSSFLKEIDQKLRKSRQQFPS